MQVHVFEYFFVKIKIKSIKCLLKEIKKLNKICNFCMFIFKTITQYKLTHRQKTVQYLLQLEKLS